MNKTMLFGAALLALGLAACSQQEETAANAAPAAEEAPVTTESVPESATEAAPAEAEGTEAGFTDETAPAEEQAEEPVSEEGGEEAAEEPPVG